MLGFYNYTVILTYISLLSSSVGIIFAFKGEITICAILLLVSGICDMYDGKIARTKKDRTDEEKKFGIQIDSLCDLICFSVFPSVIGYALGITEIWKLIILAIYPLTGVIRLGFFNVTEEIRQEKTKEKRKIYQGLPVTFSGFLAPLFLFLRNIIGVHFNTIYVLLVLVMGILHISPIKVYRPSKEK